MNPGFLNLKKSYLFIEIGKRVREYIAAHPDNKIIKMGIGDVTQPLAPVVVEAMKKAADEMGVKETFRGYEDSGKGYDFLREAVAGYYKSFGVTVSPEEVLISDGAKSDCGNIGDIFSENEDVVVTDPAYPVYVDSNVMGGRTVHYVNSTEDNGFAAMPDESMKPGLIYLCSPNNPTGSVYSKEELAGLAAVLAKYPQVVVIADEIYEHINYIGAHQSIAQFPEMKERTVIVNGVSKAYAMTGWRIGFIVKACNKLQGQYTSGPCSVSQKAAEAAYVGTQEPVKEMQKAFERRRDLIVKLAKEVPGFEVNVPQGAFYLFPKCSYFFGKSNGERKIENSDDLAMYLLEDAHVACVGGTSFGAPECIRMSYATSDENIVEAIRRIKEALAKLK